MQPGAFLTAPVHYVSVRDARIAYRRLGSGSPLVLVHGFPLTGLTWRHVIAHLATRFECYVPDVPGLGATEWTATTDFSFPGQGRTLKSFADALGLDAYTVLAHDTGGAFARYLALHDPRVERLALINTEMPRHRPPWIPFYQRLLRLPGAVRVVGWALRSDRFVRSPMAFGGCFADRALLGGDFDAHFVQPIMRSAKRRRGIRRFLLGTHWQPIDDLETRHGQIAVPVRLIWGRDDPTFPIALAREMVSQFPSADLVEIPQARLLPHEERPQEVLAALDGFGG